MTSFTTVQTAAMQRALRAAACPDAPPGPNPRVGCVILSADGDVLAEGHHRGAGSAHAEVDALANLAATGASDGDMLKGVRYQGQQIHTSSICMRGKSGTVRYISAVHSPKKLSELGSAIDYSPRHNS